MVGLRSPYADPSPSESEPSKAGPIRKGGRSQRIWSFRGPYGNRGNGMQLTSSDAVGLRSPCTDPSPSESEPGGAGPIRKGGSPVNHRAGALARLRSIHRTSDVVEAGGVEPPSENVSERTSPCAGGYCGPKALSPSGWQAVTPCRSGSFMMHGARKA